MHLVRKLIIFINISYFQQSTKWPLHGSNYLHEALLSDLKEMSKMIYLSLGLLLPLAIAVHNPQSLDDHHLLRFRVPAMPVGQEGHQVVGAHDVSGGRSLLSSSVGVDGLGLPCVIKDVALNGLALWHTGGDQSSELN